ncbi:metallophosphoesterase [Afipia carboxidovorans]|uniref:metallophosphoesterase n=1 Tax=Afipia carboxidovorans TaxID=40137 RepID=UPI0030D3E213
MTASTQPIPSGFRAPDGMRIYAVGDIHGRADLLQEKLAAIEAHHAAHPGVDALRVFVGDYIDRGADSCGVVEMLIDLGRRERCVFLRGNHEAYVLDFPHNPKIMTAWRTLGGIETLASYGIAASPEPDPAESLELANAFERSLPESHRVFYRDLLLSYEAGGLYFVHAGVRPGIPLAAQSVADRTWIRHEFLNHEGLFEKLIIHGHTPATEPEIRPNRINIDTRAFASGRLTCIWLEGGNFGFV